MVDHKELPPDMEFDPASFLEAATAEFAVLSPKECDREAARAAQQTAETIARPQFDDIALSSARSRLHETLGEVQRDYGLKLPPGLPLSNHALSNARTLFAYSLADLIRADAYGLDVPDSQERQTGLWRRIVHAEQVMGDTRAARMDSRNLPANERVHGRFGRVGAAALALFNRFDRQ